jgi:hypothetical protein
MRPSARLVRAVTAERAELERQRERLVDEARELRAALARIDKGLAEIDERCELLDRIAPRTAARETPRTTPDNRLRGPAIREAAVAALRASGADALHYRDWYELLTRAGHEIAGKDPLAVFLTQISRSPMLRKGARPGVYELDREAAQRLRRALDELHQELRELTASGDLTQIRARRAQLTAEISRTERALEEVARVAA